MEQEVDAPICTGILDRLDALITLLTAKEWEVISTYTDDDTDDDRPRGTDWEPFAVTQHGKRHRIWWRRRVS